ncbi:16S rRNA (guanine(527)-N(7))-methyltransferase RsmG [Aquamicrobium sp. LC103]|uniref:16S rRNA (guanine(527)-N(7))-methyltransferase RsmG n=1 Tax=Aquamicrobium sp. LC103 TaxID=1120658 RepID=UPI00063EA0A8|nr:16S rRNA (guanine(527)-N(7))-methyltransferase RsmG [Aquamicrobium sp. LC103]TKT82812.1 16S rRNA (guanine(527)-N(7))-methyltransferase RsmG [Aquamicrobium sp. LC103]
MSYDKFSRLQEIAGSVSRETYEELLEFEAQFRKWSVRINLASPATLDALWERHILDSAQLFTLKPEVLKWLDLGSGGGFPGAVMAILLRERAGADIDLVESNNKKAAFLQTTLARFGAPARVHKKRIEDAASLVKNREVVTARALAPLPKLLELAAPWIRTGTVGLFHKGRDYAAEIAESRSAWDFDLVEHPSKIDPAGRILEISALEPRRDR